MQRVAAHLVAEYHAGHVSSALIIKGKKTAFFLCKAYLFAVKQIKLIDLVDLLLSGNIFSHCVHLLTIRL